MPCAFFISLLSAFSYMSEYLLGCYMHGFWYSLLSLHIRDCLLITSIFESYLGSHHMFWLQKVTLILKFISQEMALVIIKFSKDLFSFRIISIVDIMPVPQMDILKGKFTQRNCFLRSKEAGSQGCHVNLIWYETTTFPTCYLWNNSNLYCHCISYQY